VAQQLRIIADRLENSEVEYGPCILINGERVGIWSIEEESAYHEHGF
jgi:hypothetical protein